MTRGQSTSDMSFEKEFYLTVVRHGQTVANASKNIQGHSDTPLTELGIEQAKALSRYFQANGHTEFDRIYSSDQGRAYETCKIISSACCKTDETSINKDKRLRERKYGQYEGKPIERLLMDAYCLGFDKTNFTLYTPEGVESMEEVCQRVAEFCHDTLWQECQQGEEVLIVSHWATIKEFLKLFQPNANGSIRKEHLLETPNVAFSRFKIQCAPNTSPLELEISINNESTIAQRPVYDSYRLNIQAISLHQTPHLSLEQNSVNLKQQLE